MAVNEGVEKRSGGGGDGGGDGGDGGGGARYVTVYAVAVAV